MLDNPFLALLGAHLRKWEDGLCEWELEIAPHHLNTQGSLQGGVIATLLDVACGYSGSYSNSESEEVRAATVSLTVHFMVKATRGCLIARARRVGGGRRIFFSEAELISDEGVIVATASGSFRRHSLSLQ
ncbi:PaaI family thioesterase [Marinobacter iranensis]|uniref:PaaI family thioesterase n=1 Tax=Marinobacter iranensis TaxID=2962607 RepID=UPI003B84891B